MKVRTTPLPGVLVLEPRVHRDGRGFFLETWSAARYREAGIDAPIVQCNHSLSGAHTIRGLHAQARRPQGKLVRVIEGAIFDVAVDIRPGSPTFGRWFGETLTAENFLQMWIPPGHAHGFAVIGDRAQVEYGCSEYYDPADEIAIAWNDPDIGIAWPFDDPVLSERDGAAPRLGAIVDRLRGGP